MNISNWQKFTDDTCSICESAKCGTFSDYDSAKSTALTAIRALLCASGDCTGDELKAFTAMMDKIHSLLDEIRNARASLVDAHMKALD